MTKQKHILKTSPANDDAIVDAFISSELKRVHPVFEIYENTLPSRIKQEAWWFKD